MNSRTRVNMDWGLIGDDQPVKDCLLTMFLNQRKDILTEFETGRIICVGTCMILWIEIEISNPKLFKCNTCAVKFATKNPRIHILQMFMKVENHSNVAFVMLANVLWINSKHISQFMRKKILWCNTCGVKFSTKQSLDLHIAAVHGGRTNLNISILWINTSPQFMIEKILSNAKIVILDSPNIRTYEVCITQNW